MRLSENDIQNSILEYLRYKRIVSWRQGSHAVYDSKARTYRRKSKYEINGVSDILGILPDGRFLAIEVKRSAKEKPSKDQREFIETINNSKGIGFVAYSLECVEAALCDYI